MNRALSIRSKNGSSDPLITIVCDNYTIREDLIASWGFSCLIRHEGRNILFDTGSDGIVLLKNMAILGISPSSIDLLMISHQHWDHTGGIYSVLNEKGNLPVCLPRSFSTRFKEDMRRYGAEIIEVEKAVEILPGFYTTGDMEGVIREQAALFRTTAGMVVITGCAHPGIIKIIKTAKDVLPDHEIALVMGGFHLLEDDDNQILDTIAQFKRSGVRYAAATHCSGQAARTLFAGEYDDHFIALGAGSVISLNSLT
jgi:7,8-dihydropterin-6-yl-methyl-4-(beta-D-ribofuranosyl)aminobenzene 5'-phosphate synthase